MAGTKNSKIKSKSTWRKLSWSKRTKCCVKNVSNLHLTIIKDKAYLISFQMYLQRKKNLKNKTSRSQSQLWDSNWKITNSIKEFASFKTKLKASRKDFSSVRTVSNSWDKIKKICQRKMLNLRFKTKIHAPNLWVLSYKSRTQI